MSGHNKWSQIKTQKAAGDAKKSKIFGKLAQLITQEAKKSGGNLNSPGLKTAVERARAANMPNDVIDRAIKKATSDNSAALETIIYESYGPGGCAMIIEALTSNKNKAAQEIKHILSLHGLELASPGSASWAFKKDHATWTAITTVPLEDADIELLTKLVEDLEADDEVQEVFTNAE